MAFFASSAVSKIDPTNTRPEVGSTDRVGPMGCVGFTSRLGLGVNRLMMGIGSRLGAGRSGVQRLMNAVETVVGSNLTAF